MGSICTQKKKARMSQRSRFTPPSSPTATAASSGNRKTPLAQPPKRPNTLPASAAPTLASRYGHPAQPSFIEDPAFLRAESRKRRFDAPNLNSSDYYDDGNMEYLRQTLEQMNQQVDEMQGHVSQFADEKSQYFAEEEKNFDENGNRILQYDEFGNLIDQSVLGQQINPTSGSLIKIEIPLLQITQGWLWKKGRGVTPFSRQWKRRYFQIDLERIRPIYYFGSEQRAMVPLQHGEAQEDYRQRKASYWAYQREHPLGTFYLSNESEVARVAVNEHEPEHTNANIRNEWVFHLYVPGEGNYALCAENENDYVHWINTINYICQVMGKNREIVRNRGKNGTVTGSTNDQNGIMYSQEQIDHRRDFALTAVHAYGKGLFEAAAGYPAEFFIQGTDPGIAVSLEQITAVMESRELHYDLTVVPFGGEHGLFQVTYTPTRPGKYELSVLLDKFDIQNSPFHPTVRPAPVSAPHCIAEGTALYCGIAGGVVNRIVIKCRNLFGEELRNVRGVEFQLRSSNQGVIHFCDVNGTLLAHPKAFENEDGTYAAYYLVNENAQVVERLKSGEAVEAMIHIELDDGLVLTRYEGEQRETRPIKGSPFALVLAESATGQALATAAKHASMILNGQQMDELLSFAEDPSFLRMAGDVASTLPSQIAPSFIEEAEKQQQQQQQQQQPAPVVQSSQRSQQQQQQQQQRLAKEAVERGRAGSQQSTNNWDEYPPTRRQYDDDYQRQVEEEDRYVRQQYSYDDGYRRSRQPEEGIYQRPYSYNDQDSYATATSASGRTFRPSNNTSSFRGNNNNRPSFLEEELQRERKLQQQREQELVLEREQLLKMKRELQQGQNEMQEHLSRLNLSSNSSNYDGLPVPPAQYRKTAQAAAKATTNSKSPSNATALTLSDNASDSRELSRNPFDSEITAMFNSKARELKRIFRTYSAFQDGIPSPLKQVTLTGFLACWVDFEICPTFISKREVESVYKKRITNQGLNGMDFPLFVECLGLVAFAALDKQPLCGMYPTAAKKIGVLLHMWRFGDSIALDNIIKKHKYGRS
ncbi:hypothetical protein BASA81_007927 [Batrachochytrium salamandrivorans]|nr:hypothetical protein BASA81_007927 [Batrachochytrium salamandrivorans]